MVESRKFTSTLLSTNYVCTNELLEEFDVFFAKEKVQRRLVKMVSDEKENKYEEQLESVGRTSSTERLQSEKNRLAQNKC